MGRIYYVGTQAVAVTAIQDLVEILPADDKPVVLHAFSVSQSSDTDSEMLRVRVKRLPATVTSGSGGSAPTIQKQSSADASAGFAAEANNTTQATTSSTAQIIAEEDFNVLTGLMWVPIPEIRPVFVQGEALIIDLPAAPVDSLTLSFYAVVEELG